MTISVNWSYPTNIRFGPGRIQELGEVCLALNIKNPLLVTDKGLAGLEITENAVHILKSSGFQGRVFSDVDPNPNEINLEAGIIDYQKGNHDGVIAFGGGSGIDLGKMIAFMAGQTRPIWDFEDIGDWWTRADSNVIAPIVAVPTTAGTGSEVGRASVITNSKTHEKKIIFHPKVLPSAVICDPELTVGMPSFITAGTGLDAFAHCVEAFSSPHYHPMSQGIAVEGMKLVIQNLPIAYNDPNNIEARSHMMSAAMMGATAFQKGLGAIHALSHPIGAIYNTHHGTTNAVCMPAVLDMNADKISDRFNQVSSYLGIENGFSGFCAFVREFNASLKIPENLSGLGVANVDIKKLTEEALKDPSCGGNPIELNSQNVLALIKKII
ncbi:MAG: iron-containing alcohol dehydrogenase [Paracoccaceae bacterium]